MKRKIIQYGNPILEQVSESVDVQIISDVQNIIDDMLDTLESVEDHSAGLSAPQVGVLKRIAICRRVDQEKIEDITKRDQKPIWEIMINPEIISKSKEQSKMYEGCLSINRGDLFGMIERPKQVEVAYLDRSGKSKKIKASGFLSHIIQHEVDHLDGILFLKYVSDPLKLLTSDELDSKGGNDD